MPSSLPFSFAHFVLKQYVCKTNHIIFKSYFSNPLQKDNKTLQHTQQILSSHSYGLSFSSFVSYDASRIIFPNPQPQPHSKPQIPYLFIYCINHPFSPCFLASVFIGGQYQVEMSLSIFAVRNEWYRNGIWWFTKVANRLIGESRYDAIRVQRRIFSNKFYYLRQHLLYRCYIESPDVANMIGIYPKTDSSHGYGNPISYEMYRDFQENTINSDGSFGMWVVVICAIYVGHAAYSYFMPWYWNKTASCKNGEEQRIRIRDALSSTIIEDTLGFQFLEWGFNPHYTYYVRHKLVEGHAHPDDVRAMACSGLTRKNRYVEHFGHIDNKRMIGPF